MGTPTTNGTIVLRYADHVLPDAFRKHAIDTGKSFYGISMWDEDKQLALYAEDGQIDDEGFKQSIDEVQSLVAIYYFADYPKDYLQEDMQPWELLRDKNNMPVANGFYEGNFGQPPMDSAHVSAYYAHERLSKMMKTMFRLCKEDLDALYEEMKSQDFQDEVTELFQGDGSIVIHFKDNRWLWFANPSQRKQTYDWGMSNLVHTGGVTAEPAKKKNPFAGMGPIKKAVDTVKSAVKSDDRSTPAISDDKPKPTTLAGLVIQYSDRLKYPPIEQWRKNGKVKWSMVQSWYMEVRKSSGNLGAVPDGAKQAFEEGKQLPGVFPAKVWAEIEQEHQEMIRKGIATDIPEQSTAAAQVAAVINKEPVKIEPKKKDLPEAAYIPVLSEKSKSVLQDFQKRFLSGDGTIIPNVQPSAKLEKDYANLLDNLGISSFEEIMKYDVPLEGWHQVSMRHDLARFMMWSLFNEVRRLRNAESPASSVTETATSKKSPFAGMGPMRKAG